MFKETYHSLHNETFCSFFCFFFCFSYKSWIIFSRACTKTNTYTHTQTLLLFVLGILPWWRGQTACDSAALCRMQPAGHWRTEWQAEPATGRQCAWKINKAICQTAWLQHSLSNPVVHLKLPLCLSCALWLLKAAVWSAVACHAVQMASSDFSRKERIHH